MTSQAEVPGADAVYLYREEITEDREGNNADGMDNGTDRLNYRSTYVRLKVLSEAGKRYADVELSYDPRVFTIGSVAGRTIHSDGTIVPFTGKPYEKVVEKSRGNQISETVFTMPDVQVGSILEYRYFLRYNSSRALPPQWYVQQELFLRSGHFYFRPTTEATISGHDKISSGVAYTEVLPPGSAVKFIFSQDAYELSVRNVVPIPDEEFTPPLHSLTFRVLFYYTGYHTSTEFWTAEGRYWSRDIDRFAAPSPKMKEAVAQIIGSADSDGIKVHKIYNAVMALENTSFTREHTQAENKAAGIKVKTADDIWAQKRGNDDEIALLFIAMVRAAGLNAYAMAVTNRDTAIFSPGYLSMDQLDDLIAIVPVGGKEQFLDPGQRYCAFGQLNWKHSMTGGLRQQSADTGGAAAAVAATPGFGYEDAQTIRVAQLVLTPDGRLTGTIKVKLNGPLALYWRQRALRTDEDAVKHEFEESLQQALPPGVEVKTNRFVALADWTSDLTVMLDVSGSMGAANSARHIFLPSSFFEASEKPLFVHDKREDPIDLYYPSQQQDTVNLTLPAGYTIETLPRDTRMPLPKDALFVTRYTLKANTYTQLRIFILANPFYKPNEYPDLKDFYQKVNAQDQQQTVLTAGASGQ